MPHLVMHALEDDLDGREPALIGGLTDAVVGVYGEWARELVSVQLVGCPRRRWGTGGHATGPVAPTVTFGIREEALTRRDGADVARRLIASVTDAITGVFGESIRPGVMVELVGTRADRVGVGGALVADR